MRQTRLELEPFLIEIGGDDSIKTFFVVGEAE
jgi:hypothetical protein